MIVLVSILLALLTILALANLILLIRLARRVQAHRRLDSRIAAMLLIRRPRRLPPRGQGHSPRGTHDVTGGFRDPCR